MIVVTTPTGQIGRLVAEELIARGLPVRVIVRDPDRLSRTVAAGADVVQGSHLDAGLMLEVLADASGLLLVIPPGLQGADASARYLTFARPSADALAERPDVRIVNISSAGHGWRGNAGVLSAAFAVDAELAGAGTPLRALCPPWYMENLLSQADRIRDEGVLSLPFAPDRILHCVAVADIASKAIGLLGDLGWSGQAEVPVFGPDRLTPTAMAATLASVLQRPVAYVRSAPPDLMARLRSIGATPAMAEDYGAMIAAVDEGIYDSDAGRSEGGRTSFRAWCDQRFR